MGRGLSQIYFFKIILHSFPQPSVASEMTGQSFYAASSASMYGGFSRSVFGSVSGRSSPESVSEDLAEPSSGYHDKFATSLGGTGKNSQIQVYKLLMQNRTFLNLFILFYADIQTRPTFVREELTEADLDKMVTVLNWSI